MVAVYLRREIRSVSGTFFLFDSTSIFVLCVRASGNVHFSSLRFAAHHCGSGGLGCCSLFLCFSPFYLVRVMCNQTR